MPQVMVGRIRPVFKILKSPVAAKVCIAYQTTVYELKRGLTLSAGVKMSNMHWEKQFTDEKSVDFWLVGTGKRDVYVPLADFRRFGVKQGILETPVVIDQDESIPQSIQVSQIV